MKDKLKKEYLLFKSCLNKYDIYIIFICLFMLVFNSITHDIEGYGFYDYLYFSLSDTLNFIICLCLFVYINNKVLKNYCNNTEIINRYTSKKKYYNYVIKKMIIINLLIYLIAYILISLFLLIKNNNMGSIYYYYYGVSSYIYLLFFATRLIIITITLSLISSFIYRIYKNNVTLIVPFIIAILPSNQEIIIDEYIPNIFKMKLMYYNYFSYIRYESFSLEILSSIIYVLLLTILLYLIIRLSFKKSIGD